MPLLALLLSVIHLTAQNAPGQPTPVRSPALTTVQIDADFEADIRNFCDVLGVRKTLLEHRDQAIDTSRAALLRADPNRSPEFMAEWTRRMRAQLTPDLFVDALVPIVARFFTDKEIRSLIAYRTAIARHQQVDLPPDLAKKMDTVLPVLQASFADEVSRLAVKLGADVAAQIKRATP